jgi:hypothetical protein
MTAQTIATQTGRTLRIRAVPTGSNCWVAEIRAGNHRLIFDTETHFTQQSAEACAFRWVARRDAEFAARQKLYMDT